MSELDAYLELANLMSLFMIKNSIPVIENKEELFNYYSLYQKKHSFAGIHDLQQLIHKEKKHSNSKVRLECNNALAHCLECYYDLANEPIYNASTACEHGKQIIPKLRMRILNEHNRVEKLFRTCQICDKKKDAMDFAILKTHIKCIVCTECIINTYDARNKHNNCQICRDQLEEESEIIIRSIVEAEMTDKELFEKYKENCPQCNKEVDGRELIRVCKNECTACSACFKKLLRNEVNECKKLNAEGRRCDGEISVVRPGE